MLQIATGKLFSRPVIRTNRLRGVLYSNATLDYAHPLVQTDAGELRDTDRDRRVHAPVFEMDERIETHASGKDFLISHTLRPYLDDFAVLGTFGFNVVMSADPEVVRRLTTQGPSLASYESPRRFMSRVFEDSIALSADEIRVFEGFTRDLMGLERRRFLHAMQAMRTYVAALHRLQDDLGLSYTLMVSAVEGLAQGFDGFEPLWSDIDHRKREAVDEALRDVPQVSADAVRSAVLAGEHIALSRRYRAFVGQFIDADFFTHRPDQVGRPIARYELDATLRAAYAMRSAYLHNLQQLPDALTHPHGFWETTELDRRPVLTFEGLARLTRYVIRRFVELGPRWCGQSA